MPADDRGAAATPVEADEQVWSTRACWLLPARAGCASHCPMRWRCVCSASGDGAVWYRGLTLLKRMGVCVNLHRSPGLLPRSYHAIGAGAVYNQEGR